MQDFQSSSNSSLACSEYLSGRQKILKEYLNKHKNNKTSLLVKSKRQNKIGKTNLKCRNGRPKNHLRDGHTAAFKAKR